MSAKTHYPETAEACAKLVDDACQSGSKIEILGCGSKTRIGHKVEADIKLSTSKLSGIVEYTPTELVMTALSGTRLSEIQKTLDKNNQMLAFEPPNYAKILGASDEQTIGGIFATNLSGSRRLSAGAARDGLLGVKFVNGKGEQIKTGGKVMKNVTGLDMVKLLAGSWGTLGLMTEVTFKVLPKPETQATLVVDDLSDVQADRAMVKAMAQSTDVSSAAHIPQELVQTLLDGALSTKAATLFRLEGLDASVKLRIDKLVSALEGFGNIELIDDKYSQLVWNEIANVEPFAGTHERNIWKISVAPTAGHKLMSALKDIGEADGFYDWQGGLVWLAISPEITSMQIREQIALLGGGHALLIKSVQEERNSLEIFEPLTGPIAALSARIKHKLDPSGMFNPGRMYQDDKESATALEVAS